MKSTLRAFLAIAAAGHAAALPSSIASKDAICAAQNATSFAVMYGDPLFGFQKIFNSTPAVNQLFPQTEFVTPADTAVVSPNVDTLYISMIYDVSSQDIELAVPAIDEDRNWGAAWYTPYGDNYVTFGAVTQATPGTYLLTIANSTETSGTMQADPSGKYTGVLYAPNTWGTLLIRILVKYPGNETDLDIVHGLQNGYVSTLVDGFERKAVGPALTGAVWANSSSSQAEYLLDITARFAQIVPKVNDGNIIPLNTTATLAAAGISADGTYEQPDCVNLTAAVTAVQRALFAFQADDESWSAIGNGWKMPKPEYVGVYDTNYGARTFMALTGYLAMLEDEALYPMYENGAFTLQSNESYILHFTGKPPVTNVGFWSVTMYNADKYLVDNPLNRYNIGDRSNLTYDDDMLVYGSEVDAPFNVLVQAAEPPANWTSNWLPSPSEPGEFNMLLRFYAPEESLQNGDYIAPLVTKGAAVI